MYIAIMPTEQWRINDFDLPLPLILDRNVFPSWHDDFLEEYARNWARWYKSDIVMMVEEEPCEHANKKMESVVVGQGLNRHMVSKQFCKDCGLALAIY